MGPLTSTRLIQPCASQKNTFHARAKCSIYTVVSNSLTTCGELSSLFFDATGHRGNHLQHRNYRNQWPSLWKRFCTFLPASQGPVLPSCLLHSGVDFTCRVISFFIYLIIYFSYIWLHKATSITTHKWLSLSRCWKSHWDYAPPGEAVKGPLCLGTRFVPNAARQIYLFKIRPLSNTATASLCFHNIKKKGPQRRADSKTLHILPCRTGAVEMCPCVITESSHLKFPTEEYL